MSEVIAFDVYGTLIDTHGVVSHLATMMGPLAQQFSQTWRDKQLEYSFRRGLMQNYENFAICTQQALEYACQFHKQNLSSAQKSELLDLYKTLPAFEDAARGLSELSALGCRLFAFSNGTSKAIETLLSSANLRDSFEAVVSVDPLKSFKPNPAVYAHFLRQSEINAGSAWLVSSNPFDVIGAISAGMRAAWVRRSADAIFDPWGIEPTITVSSLAELASEI